MNKKISFLTGTGIISFGLATSKKRISLFFSLMLMLILSSVTVSCLTSDKEDVDDGVLDVPKYETFADRFSITSENSPYSSIEFTASGNYLIIDKGYNPFYMPDLARSDIHMHVNMFCQIPEIYSRDISDGIIYGKYTVNSDGEYILDGFGTIRVISDGSTSVDLEITTNSGHVIVVGANRDNIMAESEMTNKLCRTWIISKVRVAYWEGGFKIFDKTLPMNKFGDLDLDGDYAVPDNVIFTKAGTYMVKYTNGALAVSTWRWENEKKGILRYSWDYDDLYDEFASNTVELRFNGNKLVIREGDYDKEEEDEKIIIEWIMTEI